MSGFGIDCKNLWIMKLSEETFCDLVVNTWYPVSRIDEAFDRYYPNFYIPLRMGGEDGIQLIKCTNIFAKQKDGTPFYILKKSVGRPDPYQGRPDIEKIKDYINSLPLEELS